MQGEMMNIDVGFREWELTPLHVQWDDFKNGYSLWKLHFAQRRT